MDQWSNDEVRKEIWHSAREWGLRISSSDHGRFCEEVTNVAIKTLKQPPDLLADWNAAYGDLRTSKLPVGSDAAIREVLKTELVGSRELTYTVAKDNLGLGFQPFFRNMRSNGLYERRREYNQFSLRELDPFNRFTGIDMNNEDWYHLIWHDDNGSLLGTVFEAIVAQYMECEMACESCKCVKSLRWNGGYGMLSSWSDVVCIECRATYEIKSKADIEKVERALRFNNIRGNSFKTFYKYHPGHTRYLVIVSRAASFDPNEGMTHRVSIGTIDKVFPRLTADSFVDRKGSGVHIVAEIMTKRETVNKEWFHIPEYRGEFLSLAREVFDAEFGPGRWDRKAKDPKLPKQASALAEEVQQKAKSDADLLLSIGASLEELKLGGDNV